MSDNQSTVSKSSTIFLGDTHGDFNWIIQVLEKDAKIDTVIQVGDFGYWEHTKEGVAFLDGLSEICSGENIEFYFLDGNHENHDMLVGHNNGLSYGDDPVWVRDGLWWLPRGSTLLLEDGRTMMALGGAPSVDVAHRTRGVNWWAGEEITQVDKAFAMGKSGIDILASHDAPSDLSLWQILAGSRGFNLNQSMKIRCAAHRQIVSDVFASCGAKSLVHGHYHQAATSNLDDGRMVYGLSNERTRGSVAYLDQVQ